MKKDRLIVAIMMAGTVASIALTYHPKIAQAIIVSPVRLELDADPGKTLNSSFKLFNEQPNEITLYVTAARFEAKDDESGDPLFVPGKEGLSAWINLPSSVVVPAKSFKEVPFQINVPTTAQPGGYFAATFVSAVPPSPGEGNNIALRSQVGTIVLFRVNGKFHEGETLLEYDTKAKQHFFSSLPVEFYYRFQNGGDDRVKPLGDITIRNMFGWVSKLVNANPSAGSVLPKSTRRYNMAWITARDDKTETNLNTPAYLPQGATWIETMRWQWNHFALGRYTANLKVSVNHDSSRLYGAKTSFWVVPWQLLITIIGAALLFFGIILALAVIIVVFITRNRRKKS